MSLTPIADILDRRRTDEAGTHFQTTEDWAQGRTIFGGLTAALMLQSIRDRMGHGAAGETGAANGTAADRPGHRALRSLQLVFAAPVPFGPTRVQSTILRAGKSATLARAEIIGTDGAAALVTAAFGESRSSAIHVPTEQGAAVINPQDLPELPYFPQIVPAFLQQVRLRWARGTFPYSGSAETATSIYLHWRSPIPDTETGILLYADAVPSPVLSMLPGFAQASSLTWSLEIPDGSATLPLDGWVRMDNHLESVAGGYAHHHSRLFDDQGRLRAISRQVVSFFA